ncbi:serine hydrolase domain-containing protein [Lacticaseibacillus paracasei]|jgi:CubicO group peptidase (beta-lactamase class C family)|uniref:serine hydrolase domain-containing protein n=1 Tax=Lacticaseibacillus paracasei TaxID=1597 RepID=UPI000F0B341D|nr:serine hydrolase domain-containing protein [Lacticaseibacillus paracasei]MBB1168547.1 beta-lactamase family protein [Lacticaseibacillus paracasei]RND55397.1 putative penicillin-binding protein PbpX [Lacticaseibacillus paracasei]RND74808.1 putative penicillin-binding protein PbpX [Lacticaseibacillus paracasei]RNE44634.1 putative penicillin-binding protein PbpX [Lacticaseibacillus paracasei]TEA87571.1 penicillin-binding protein [Lacticaseibacillus paracasei]
MAKHQARNFRFKFLLAMLIGILIGGLCSFAYYHFEIVPRKQQEVEKIRQKYEAELVVQRAQAQRYKNAAKKDNSQETAYQKEVSTTEGKTFEQQLENKGFVGSALIIKNGQIILNKGFGYADANQGRKNGPQTLFQIGSIQKGLTAALLMKLVEQGKVKLSDPVGKYLSGIRTGNQVTLRMMLDMRSGFRLSTLQNQVLSDDGIVRWSIENMQYYPQEYSYQPVNFALLAGVIEKVSGKSYNELVQKEIINKIGLYNTGFMPGLLKEPNRAISYTGSGEKAVYTNPYTQSEVGYNRELGTGNIYATTGDLFKMLNGIDQGQVFKKSNLAKLRDLGDGQYTAGVYNYDTYTMSQGVVGAQAATTAIDNSGKNAVVLMSNNILQGMVLHNYAQPFLETIMKTN